ncbi:MAG TPA: thiamine pyrophosphate-dependent enzyme [Xanthobacteraceae bacterium]|nr:thiamine pyrophosphate-dependent enzyme [Xanthobacteraceae bacterium]
MTEKRLNRRDVVARLVAGRDETVVIAGLGATTYDLAAAGDHPRNFYLWGAMGGAAMMGLGLALAQPALPVLVITGDGEMLMGLGAFATIALHNPRNLTIAVLDNESYAETGGQKTHTAYGTDLAAVAKACGIADAMTLRRLEEVDLLAVRAHALSEGTTVAAIKIAPGELPKVLPPRDGGFMTNRLRGALGFPPM